MNSIGSMFGSSLILAVLLGAARDATGDEVTRRRFLEEYPAASEKLREVYSNLRMVITVAKPLENRDPNQEPPIRRRVRWELVSHEFLASGGWLRLDSTSDRSSSSIVAGPDLAFRVSRDPDSGRPVIRKKTPRVEQDAYEAWVESIQNACPLPFIPYRLGSTSVLEFISDDGFRLTKVEEEERPDGRVVHVDWELLIPGDEERPAKRKYGRFTFLPESSWALQHFEILMDLEHPQTSVVVAAGEYCDVEYEGERDGIPLLKGMTHWFGFPAASPPKTIYQIVELIPGPVPEEAFTPEGFGIRSEPAP